MIQPAPRREASRTNADDATQPEGVDPDAVETIDDDHRALVLKGLDQSRRGDVASDEEVRAVLASFRR